LPKICESVERRMKDMVKLEVKKEVGKSNGKELEKSC
jgi:hypothetical protein